jgi:hypothetical protein
VTIEASDPVSQGYLLAVERFGSALQSGASIVARNYAIGTRRVRLRIVGQGLADGFHPPWNHLQDPESAPGGSGELRIDLWHRAETGIKEPEVTDAIDPFSRFPYQVSRGDRFLAVRQPETFAWLDRETRHIVGVVGDVERRALYEIGRPLEVPMLIWLRDQRVPLVHASFVAQEDRGALIVGRSGSGKSTLAAQCLCAGFDFLGDDKIAFARRSNGDFIGYSLNSSLHVDSASLARLPLLAGHAIAPSLPTDDKYRIAVERLFPQRLRSCAPIRALVVPSLHKEPRGRIEAASKTDALLALSLSTLLSLPIARDRSLDQLAELAEAVPAYSVDLIPEGDAPERVASLLRRSQMS